MAEIIGWTDAGDESRTINMNGTLVKIRRYFDPFLQVYRVDVNGRIGVPAWPITAIMDDSELGRLMMINGKMWYYSPGEFTYSYSAQPTPVGGELFTIAD